MLGCLSSISRVCVSYYYIVHGRLLYFYNHVTPPLLDANKDISYHFVFSIFRFLPFFPLPHIEVVLQHAMIYINAPITTTLRPFPRLSLRIECISGCITPNCDVYIKIPFLASDWLCQ